MKKVSKQLSVVVLFWNDSDKTINCLKSLFKQQKQKFDIILVDNNSDQKYLKKILGWLIKKKIKLNKIKSNNIAKKRNINKQLFYIRNKINYGCGLGHNPGYKFCLKN